MATKLYVSLTLRDGVEGSGSGQHVAAGFWDIDTAQFQELGDLKTTKGAGVGTQTDATQNGPFTGALSVHGSFPVAEDFTLSGTVTFNLWGLESNIAANAGFVCRLYKLAHDGVMTQIVGDSAHGTELGTSAAVRNWTAAPTSTDFVKGDRLVLFWGYTDKGGTMASGHTVQERAGGTTDGADGDSYVQLNEDITLDANTTISGTTLYLTDVASAVSQGVTEKALSSSRDDGAVSVVMNTSTGPIALGTNQWTDTAGGTAVEWYSDPLRAFTLAGKVYVKLRGSTSNGASGASPIAELAVCDADGSNAVVWARTLCGQVASGFGYLSALSTSEATRDARLAGPDTPVTVGQRIRLRVYCDESYFVSGGHALVAGHTATLNYGATSGGGAADSFITFEETLQLFAPFLEKKPKRIVGPELLGNAPGTTIYTVPSSAACWVRHIVILNPTGNNRTVTLSIGPDGATTRVFDNRVITAGGRIDERKAAEHWLNAGEVIQANADAASVCAITIDAIEYSELGD